MLLRLILMLVLLSVISSAKAQSVDAYFEKIRNNKAELTAFISQMPKGGDLHHHYSGSIYTESYINWVIENNYCIDPESLAIAQPDAIKNCSQSFISFSDLKKNGQLAAVRNRLLQFWSAKDYDQVHTISREQQFFSAFGKFTLASDLNYNKGLTEIKQRALAENVSYIETMFTRVPMIKTGTPPDIVNNTDTITFYNQLLVDAAMIKDPEKTMEALIRLYGKIKTLPLQESAERYNHYLDSLHRVLKIDDAQFTMRYQTYINRLEDPVKVFSSLILSFETVKHNPLLVGVNIVAPEDDPASMQNYWLHMQMFKFCSRLYPAVKYAMHAGELTEGLVEPEQLTWHITAAVMDAGAQRIGHGVDIAFEKDNYKLLRYMHKKNIAVEINLTSNEFILGVKNDSHPITLYHAFNVPLVICTDDAGILRSSLTEQYMLLASRYKSFKYADLKKIIYNSIRYSFIQDEKLKKELINNLNDRFSIFEKYINTSKP